ncbi:MAG TPA: hypothetical protein VF813_09625, partial [Anaerolineaceae bacterium]
MERFQVLEFSWDCESLYGEMVLQDINANQNQPPRGLLLAGILISFHFKEYRERPLRFGLSVVHQLAGIAREWEKNPLP